MRGSTVPNSVRAELLFPTFSRASVRTPNVAPLACLYVHLRHSSQPLLRKFLPSASIMPITDVGSFNLTHRSLQFCAMSSMINRICSAVTTVCRQSIVLEISTMQTNYVIDQHLLFLVRCHSVRGIPAFWVLHVYLKLNQKIRDTQ